MAGQLTGDDQLLLIAAGEIRRAQVGDAWPDIEAFHQALAAFGDGFLVQERAATETGFMLIAEHGGFGGGKAAHQAETLTVFGNMGNADGPHTRGIADGIGADLTVADADRTGAGRPDAGQDLQQFALAVAADPGDADDFAGTQGQVDIAQAIDTTLIAQ